MKKVVLFVTIVVILISSSVISYSQTTTPSTSTAVQTAWNNFKTTFPSAFANFYLLDGGTIKTMLAAGATSVRICNAMQNSGSHTLIFIPCDKNNKPMNIQYYFENYTDLCPQNCDVNANVTPAIQISVTTANTDIANYTNSKQPDSIRSFLINSIASLLGSGNNIKVYNVIDKGVRTIAVVALNGSGVETGTYYIVDASTVLCPPNCE